MSGAQEIERKFLPTRALPDDLDQYPCEEIRQGYLAVAGDGTEVRVRARRGDYTLTVKSGPSRTRVEEEIGIDGRRFESLWALTAGRRIEKRRYLIRRSCWPRPARRFRGRHHDGRWGQGAPRQC